MAAAKNQRQRQGLRAGLRTPEQSEGNVDLVKLDLSVRLRLDLTHPQFRQLRCPVTAKLADGEASFLARWSESQKVASFVFPNQYLQE